MRTDLDLNQLSHFLAVAKTGNFTRAANLTKISQPSLSRSIQKLEQVIGQPLFERQARGVKLTETGIFLETRAKQIKDLIDNTFSELDESNNIGQIRLAIIPTIAPYMLPTLLKTFARIHPEIKITIREDTTQNIIEQANDGDIDIAIVALPIMNKHLKVEPLFKEELVLALPKNHPLKNKKIINLKDIESFSFITLDPQHCLSDNIAEHCTRKSVSPVIVERTNQLSLIHI